MTVINLETTVQRGRVMTLSGTNAVSGSLDDDLYFPAGVWEVQSIGIYGGTVTVADTPVPALRFRANGGDQLYYPRFNGISGMYGATDYKQAMYYCDPPWIVQESDWLEVKSHQWGSGTVNYAFYIQAVRLR